MRKNTIQRGESGIGRTIAQIFFTLTFDSSPLLQHQKSIVTIDFFRWTQSASSAIIQIKFVLAMQQVARARCLPVSLVAARKSPDLVVHTHC